MANTKWDILTDEQKQNRKDAHKRYMAKGDKVELKITIDREKRSTIQQFASDHNYSSTTAFIVEAVDEKMERESD